MVVMLAYPRIACGIFGGYNVERPSARTNDVEAPQGPAQARLGGAGPGR
jgi:hypothetical protein